MKTALTVVALTLGCLIAGGRLCAQTEAQSPPATDAAPSAPAGIIVTPPYFIQIRPEMPPVSSPVRPDTLPPGNSPPQTCPATDHKLDLIG
jgi:hypothetical protein